MKNLILILDRALPDPFGYSNNTDFHETSLYINSNSNLIPINIKDFSKYCLIVDPDLPEIAKKSLGSKNEIISQLEKKIGIPLTECLIKKDSKIVLNILINSPGGHNVSLKQILDIIKFIKNNKGQINSFSFINTASAASYIFSFADNRYCLKLSEFICHTSQTIPEMIGIDDDNTDEENEISSQITYQEYKEHLIKFFNNKNKASSAKIDDIISKALTRINCDLCLGGYNLETYGIIIKAYYDFVDYINFVFNTITIDYLQYERIYHFIEQMQIEYNKTLDDNLKYSLPVFRC
jgi:ATP-dependent protease ClpP protease subunit